MNKLAKLLISVAMLLHLLSCTPSAPYEIKSPCVSSESEDVIGNPCIRRPVNIARDLT